MEKLSEWAKNKPPGLGMMAQQLAVGAEVCFEVLRLIKVGEKLISEQIHDQMPHG